MAIHQILDSPYQGSLRRLYLESKTLELITHNLAQLVVDKNRHNSPFTLQSGDIERVREARDVLIRNLENPPSLLELARQVGINKNKLNQGFTRFLEPVCLTICAFTGLNGPDSFWKAKKRMLPKRRLR